MAYEEITKGLEALYREHVTERGGVMTDVGPSSARAYTSILRGGPGADKPGLPPEILALADPELRKLINDLSGTKAGRKGAVGSRVPREKLLEMAAAALGVAGPKSHPHIASKSPPAVPAGASGLVPSTVIGGPPEPPPLPSERRAAESPHDLRLMEAVKRLTEAVSEANRRERTVAREVRGLSWGERMERLAKSGKLLSEEDVRRSTLKDEVTPQDIVRESERREERQRRRGSVGGRKAVAEAEAAVARSMGRTVGNLTAHFFGPEAGRAIARGVERTLGRTAARTASRLAAGAAGRAGGAAAAGGARAAGLAGIVGRLGAGGAGAGAAAGAAAGTGPPGWVIGLIVATAAVEVAFLKIPGAVQRLTGSLLEGQRHLARYNATMAAVFARLDYQKRLMDIRTAQATSGSAEVLGTQYQALLRETQWMREGVASMKNYGMAGLAVVGRAGNILIKMHGQLAAIIDFFRIAGGLGKKEDTFPIVRHLETMAAYGRGQPKNKKPVRGRFMREDRE